MARINSWSICEPLVNCVSLKLNGVVWLKIGNLNDPPADRLAVLPDRVIRLQIAAILLPGPRCVIQVGLVVPYSVIWRPIRAR